MRASATRCAALVGLAALASEAGAQARPSTLAMSCGEARGLVTRQGAVVLGTGGYTFDRFVRDASFCQPTEIGKPAFAPTRDSGACLVGYTCYEPSRNDRFGDY